MHVYIHSTYSYIFMNCIYLTCIISYILVITITVFVRVFILYINQSIPSSMFAASLDTDCTQVDRVCQKYKTSNGYYCTPINPVE